MTEPETGTPTAREQRSAPLPPARPTGVKGVLTNLPLVRRGDTPAELEGLAQAIRAAGGKADVRDVVRAYRYAHVMHEGQTRRSGEAYITHPVAVATELAELGLGTATLVAALLHDVVEDTAASLDDITAGFGAEVAHLVDGVTKLDRIRVESKEEQQAETLRKMIMAMAKDIRVLVIKLADRLHNMETIGHMPRDKQKRIAQETLDIYAPLAHRLGMQQFKLRLEDLGFKTLHPKRYDEIVAMVEDRNPEREAYIEEVMASIRDQLRELKVRGRRHRPPEALLLHLREDGAAGQGVRRDLRPRRRARHRRTRCATATRSSGSSTRPGDRSPAGSRTTSRCRRSTSTSRCTPRSSGRRAGRSRSRSAPVRCTTPPSSVSPRTGCTRTRARGNGERGPEHHRRAAVDRPAPRVAGRGRRTGRLPRVAEDRPLRRRGVRLHPEG